MPESSESQPSTRERLVETARQLFLEKGYGATSIAEILRRAGANSGSLYYFFPTKEDLLFAVLDWYTRNLWPQVITPVFDRVDDPIERVFGILDGYRRMLLATEYSAGCPIGNLALELSETHQAARRLLAENFIGWRDAVRLALDDASERLPEGIDTEDLATFVLTTMEGAVMLARTFRRLEPFDAAVSQLRDYFDRLLADAATWTAPEKENPAEKAQPKSTP